MAYGRTGVFSNPFSARVLQTDRMMGMKTRGNPSGPEATRPQPQAGYMDATALPDLNTINVKKLANRRSPYMR
jgi:hypothetical protein